MAKKTSIGGQAVIEGIMMKGPQKTALAVRIPDGSIDIEYIKEKHLKDKCKFWGLPIIRGIVNFIESMVTGYGAMMKSAEKSGFADLEEQEEAEKREQKGKPPKENKESSVFMTVLLVVASVLGVALGVFLFMYLPALAFDLINRLTGNAISELKAVFEGVIKIAIFLVYMILVSKMKDIKRVFMYHGAEHKTIFCYEAGEELTVENVRKNSRFHPRCGTSFMILMLFVGIAIGILLTALFPSLTNSKYRLLWVLVKILILPLICGVGYELLKICGRHDNRFTRAVSAPGMWMQRITTEEPEDSMIEVAIESLKAVLPDNPEEDEW